MPMYIRGRDSYQKVCVCVCVCGGGGGGGGVANSTIACRRREHNQRIEAFQLSGWALMAPACFALQVRDAGPQKQGDIPIS